MFYNDVYGINIMKSVVYKYLIPFQENFELKLPKGSKVVRIDLDQGNPYLWALVPLDETEVYTYKFKSSKTGGVIEHENELVFIDTYAIFIQMELMLYVFLEKVVASNGTETSAYDVIVNNCWRC